MSDADVRSRDRPPADAELIIEGAWVLTLDDTDTAGQLSVAVGGDRIVAVGPPDTLRIRFPGARTFDASGTVLLPGLVNAHLHPEAHILKGWVEGLDLHAWRRATGFNRALELLGSDTGRTYQRAAIRAALADCLLSGTTTVACYGVTVGADDVAAEVLADIGLNGHVTIRDRAFAEAAAVPATGLCPPRMYRLHAEEALDRDELEAASSAAARGERIVMHAAETQVRRRLARRRWGVTTIPLLDRYGLLSERMLLSHAVHLDEGECGLVVERGACIVASPAAEMKLGDGIAPLTPLAAAGVPIALGTDSAVCNNGNDLLLEARLLGLSQSLAFGAGAIPAVDLLRCATTNGARVLGEGAERGCIAAGRKADLILIDAATPRLQPLLADSRVDNVAANIVYAATGQDVRDVMVGGRWRVREGAFVDVDASQIWTDLAEAGRALSHALA